MNEDPMVSCAWLAARLDAPDVRVIDATWFMPGDPRDAKALFEERRIPGAIFFDIDAIADTESSLPHMLPSPEKFASAMRALGIGDGMRVIVYDSHGLLSAARVWWTFRVMGHDDVAVLDGGLPAWEAAALPLVSGTPAARTPRHFTAQYRADLVADFTDMGRVLQQAARQVIDARPLARFTADAPEPRPGLRGGHMPGALSVPSSSLVTNAGHLRSRDELVATFTKAGADLAKAPVCTCGSGITAAIIALALARLGRWDATIYDGSWAEWGAREDAAIVTGG